MDATRRFLIMAILCFSGGIIFMLPFLREVYYQPMQSAFGYSNTEMGVLMSVFGAFSLIAYFPGGWLADRYPPRRLITGALLATGVIGIYFASFPSYWVSVVIHAAWGATISLVFWGAMIKATRNWASEKDQGKAFGILEGGRGVSEILTSTAFLAVFAWLESGEYALSMVILLFSGTNIGLGVAAWMVLDDDRVQGGKTRVIRMSDLVTVLKMPIVWLISLVVMTAYSAYWGSFYFTPYASDVFMMSAVLAGAVGVGKMWVKPIAAVVVGFGADRIGISRSLLILFCVMTLSFLLFALLPGGPETMVLMLVNVGIASVAIFGIRGIYFALLEEGGIPIAFTGIATGIVSVVGFAPDVFMPLLGGVLLDAYPGAEGYSYLYFIVAGFGVVGILATLLIMVKSVRQ